MEAANGDNARLSEVGAVDDATGRHGQMDWLKDPRRAAAMTTAARAIDV